MKKDGEYFLDIGVKYPKQLHELYNDSLFFNKKKQILNVYWIFTKTFVQFYNANRTLKQALNHGLTF